MIPLLREFIEKTINENNFNINELRNGVSKRVFKIESKSFSYLLYIWSKPNIDVQENNIKCIEYIFSEGLKYFTHNKQILNSIGVRSPDIIKSGLHNECEYAFVEFFKGISLNNLIKKQNNIDKYYNKIFEIIKKLSQQKRSFYGPPLEKLKSKISIKQLVYNVYKEELNIATSCDKQLNNQKDKIINLMNNKMKNIVGMGESDYTLIHGELTPPHIFVLDDCELGIIDIEGLKYFDVEYEWAVLDIAYNGAILLPKNIDKSKFDFYKVCLRVGYVSFAADYLNNVDCNNKIFKQIYTYNLNHLKSIL